MRTVVSGRVEAGFISDAVDAKGLQRVALAKDHRVLVVAPDHRLLRRESTSLADVLREPFVGLADGNAQQDLVEGHARAAGSPGLDVRVRMKTFEGLCEMAAHGVGIGVVPELLARRWRRRFGFHVVPLDDDWARRHLCACFEDWRALSSTMKSLLVHVGVEAKYG